MSFVSFKLSKKKGNIFKHLRYFKEKFWSNYSYNYNYNKGGFNKRGHYKRHVSYNLFVKQRYNLNILDKSFFLNKTNLFNENERHFDVWSKKSFFFKYHNSFFNTSKKNRLSRYFGNTSDNSKNFVVRNYNSINRSLKYNYQSLYNISNYLSYFKQGSFNSYFKLSSYLSNNYLYDKNVSDRLVNSFKNISNISNNLISFNKNSNETYKRSIYKSHKSKGYLIKRSSYMYFFIELLKFKVFYNIKSSSAAIDFFKDNVSIIKGNFTDLGILLWEFKISTLLFRGNLSKSLFESRYLVSHKFVLLDESLVIKDVNLIGLSSVLSLNSKYKYYLCRKESFYSLDKIFNFYKKFLSKSNFLYKHSFLNMSSILGFSSSNLDMSKYSTQNNINLNWKIIKYSFFNNLYLKFVKPVSSSGCLSYFLKSNVYLSTKLNSISLLKNNSLFRSIDVSFFNNSTSFYNILIILFRTFSVYFKDLFNVYRSNSLKLSNLSIGDSLFVSLSKKYYKQKSNDFFSSSFIRIYKTLSFNLDSYRVSMFISKEDNSWLESSSIIIKNGRFDFLNWEPILFRGTFLINKYITSYKLSLPVHFLNNIRTICLFSKNPYLLEHKPFTMSYMLSSYKKISSVVDKTLSIASGLLLNDIYKSSVSTFLNLESLLKQSPRVYSYSRYSFLKKARSSFLKKLGMYKKKQLVWASSHNINNEKSNFFISNIVLFKNDFSSFFIHLFSSFFISTDFTNMSFSSYFVYLSNIYSLYSNEVGFELENTSGCFSLFNAFISTFSGLTLINFKNMSMNSYFFILNGFFFSNSYLSYIDYLTSKSYYRILLEECGEINNIYLNKEGFRDRNINSFVVDFNNLEEYSNSFSSSNDSFYYFLQTPIDTNFIYEEDIVFSFNEERGSLFSSECFLVENSSYSFNYDISFSNYDISVTRPIILFSSLSILVNSIDSKSSINVSNVIVPVSSFHKLNNLFYLKDMMVNYSFKTGSIISDKLLSLLSGQLSGYNARYSSYLDKSIVFNNVFFFKYIMSLFLKRVYYFIIKNISNLNMSINSVTNFILNPFVFSTFLVYFNNIKYLNKNSNSFFKDVSSSYSKEIVSVYNKSINEFYSSSVISDNVVGLNSLKLIKGISFISKLVNSKKCLSSLLDKKKLSSFKIKTSFNYLKSYISKSINANFKSYVSNSSLLSFKSKYSLEVMPITDWFSQKGLDNRSRQMLLSSIYKNLVFKLVDLSNIKLKSSLVYEVSFSTSKDSYLEKASMYFFKKGSSFTVYPYIYNKKSSVTSDYSSNYSSFFYNASKIYTWNFLNKTSLSSNFNILFGFKDFIDYNVITSESTFFMYYNKYLVSYLNILNSWYISIISFLVSKTSSFSKIYSFLLSLLVSLEKNKNSSISYKDVSTLSSTYNTYNYSSLSKNNVYKLDYLLYKKIVFFPQLFPYILYKINIVPSYLEIDYSNKNLMIAYYPLLSEIPFSFNLDLRGLFTFFRNY